MSATTPLTTFASLAKTKSYQSVPTPGDVIFNQANILAQTAMGLRVLIISYLHVGKTIVEGMYSDMVIDLISDEFNLAGWAIINHGTYLELKAVRASRDIVFEELSDTDLKEVQSDQKRFE